MNDMPPRFNVTFAPDIERSPRAHANDRNADAVPAQCPVVHAPER
jgi:hypothetical protein